jgi:hypothetical protein
MEDVFTFCSVAVSESIGMLSAPTCLRDSAQRRELIGASMLMRTPLRWVRPKRQLPPGFIVPCQPTLADKVPEGDGWIHELKHDGFRILAFKDGDKVRLWSRNGRDWSAEFVAITEAMRAPAVQAHHAGRRGGRALPGGPAGLSPAARRRAGHRVLLRL